MRQEVVIRGNNLPEVGKGHIELTLITSPLFGIFSSKKNNIYRLRANVRDVQNNLTTYVFIDGIPWDRCFYGSEFSLTTDVWGTWSQTGTHSVELYQFVNDDPAKGIVTHKTVKYSQFSSGIKL